MHYRRNKAAIECSADRLRLKERAGGTQHSKLGTLPQAVDESGSEIFEILLRHRSTPENQGTRPGGCDCRTVSAAGSY